MRGGVKVKILECTLLGILNYLLYLNKEISLAFLLVYIAMEMYYFSKEFRRKTEPKKGLIRIYGLFSTVLSFAVCFLVMKLTLFRGMGNSYNQMGIEAIASVEGFSFLWYTFLYNILFAIVAFMAVPVIFPLLQWKNMDGEEKRCYTFSVLSLVLILFVISYTISVREDIGKEGIRQHTRYYEPLFILFMINFMSAMTKEDNKIRYKDWLLPTVVSVLILGIVKKIGIGSSVDSCMLKYYQYAQVRFNDRWVKVLQGAICGGTILFTVAWKKYKKSMTALSLGIISAICIVNNVFAINRFGEEYGRISGQHVEEWEKLNVFLKDENSSVLVILKEQYDHESRFADTYLRACPEYIVQEETGELSGNMETYKDIKYVLTYAYRGIKDAEMKMRCGPYTLYERTDMQHIELIELPVFPVLNNQTRIITSEENVFLTQSKAKNRKYSYISDKEEGFLICGPYSKVQPGLYDVTVYYGYEGKEEEGNVIGRLDMKCNEEEPEEHVDLKAGNSKAELKGIKVEEAFDYGEVRIFTTVPGVIFYKAEIRRNEE